jgi:hypothetical protein
MKLLKSSLCGLAALLAFTLSTPALPLEKGVVPNDAKWLIHLDVDNLRDSKVGQTLINEILAEPLAKLKTEMKVDGQLILQKLHSVTAFGNNFEAGPKADGVLLLSGEEDLQKIVEGLLAAQMLQDTNSPIKKVQQDGFAVYSMQDQVFLSPRVAGQIVVSKSREQLEAIRNHLTGKAKAPNAGKAFSDYAHVPNAFFFLAVAEGFNEKAALPPQARILKMAEGARIVLGEKADLLFVNLALKAKDSEIIQQIRQVLEGMTALVALGQSENKELMELMQGTKVSSTDKTVTVNIEYPLAKAMAHLNDVTKHVHKALNGNDGHAHRTKSKSKKSAEKPADAEAPEPNQ